MIELHTWGTPNGRKVSIMLEECGLPYSVHKIDISKGEQFKPEFLRISPNNRIPAIVDPDGPGGKPISLFESGAILIYLAEKTGTVPAKDPVQKYKTLEWLMWQMGGVGPDRRDRRSPEQCGCWGDLQELRLELLALGNDLCARCGQPAAPSA